MNTLLRMGTRCWASLAAAGRILLMGGLLLGGIGLAGSPAAGQAQDPIPRNPDAELMFEQGVAAFERGAYEKAAERFRLVNDYGLNQKTTAALVMQGKALLRLGRYGEAMEAARTLLDRFPETSYREKAEALLSQAQEYREQRGGRVDTLHIGVALPMTDEHVALSQTLFNGVRLAVDEHNGLRRRYVTPPGLSGATDSFEVATTAEAYGDSLAEAEGRTTVTTATDTVRLDSLQVVTDQVERPDWIARMHFRETAADPDRARAAVDSLIQYDEVDVVIGPLFSNTARAVGEVADRTRTPVVAPLATDESVSADREYMFQANTPIPLRGRLMARFARGSLLLDRVGIVYERGNRTSAQMAEGLQEAATQEGLAVPFTLRLDNPRGWSRLPEAIEDDSTVTDSMVAEAEALYLPIAGRNATGKIQDALTGLDRLNKSVRALGNSQWHNLSVEKEASKFTATYANDFYVQTDRPEVKRFIRRHRLLTGQTPDELSVARGRRLVYTGYDLAHFLLTTLTPSPTRLQPEELRTDATYKGLGIQIDFGEGTVNRAMFFHRYRNNRIELLQ